MVDNPRSAGVEQALLAKLEQQILPKTLHIKDQVDAGHKLMDSDMVFLENVLQGLRRDGAQVQDNPKWETLYTRLVNLYNQIMSKALENEQRG